MIADAWTVILIGGLATFAIRGSFLLVAGRLPSTPEGLREAFRMIPPAALAALAAPAILRPDVALELLGPRSIAGVVALVVAWLTRSVLLTIVAGMLVVVGAEWLL